MNGPPGFASLISMAMGCWIFTFATPGLLKAITAQTSFFINRGNNGNGVPAFRETAAEYGIDDKGFSTHAAFFDYDRDGDLDIYVLNNAFGH